MASFPHCKRTKSFMLVRRFLSQSFKFNQESQLVFIKEKNKKQRKDTNLEDEENIKKEYSLTVTKDNQYDLLSDLITPLWRVPYDKQLKMKWRWSRYVLNQFCSSKHKSKCNVEDTIPSPVTEGYRNKSEMNIRKGIDGNMKTVGCFIGATGIDYKSVICVSPKFLINMPERHKQITQMYQDFIRSSPLPAMHNLFDDGYWKNLTIRTNNLTGDTMVITTVHPQNYSEENIYDNAMKLKEYFKDANITSLYHQSCRNVRCSNEVAPYKLLSGEPYLYDTLHGYQFRISPDSFFQINKPAAELLYSRIIKLASLEPNSVVLDLCCGAGAISILCSPFVRSCVGIDIMPQAIEDAKANAKLNNITNCHFLVGRLEKVLHKVLSKLDYTSNIVAVINPSRNGVEPGIIKTIRYCKQISKLIYVSCKADGPNTIKNFHDLCNPSLCTGERFYVKNITPVDLFPHTHHCELVLLFER